MGTGDEGAETPKGRELEDCLSNNVISLAHTVGDSTHTDVVTTLRDALAYVEANPDEYDKCLVVLIDTKHDKFAVGYFCAKIKTSDMIAACEIMKARAIAMMGWLLGPDNPPQ